MKAKPFKPQYELVDVAEISKQHPETFGVASKKRIDALEVNQFAKLYFKYNKITERMWVIVTHISKTRHGMRYVGILNNDPFVFPPDVIKDGDTVEFKQEHIVDILKG